MGKGFVRIFCGREIVEVGKYLVRIDRLHFSNILWWVSSTIDLCQNVSRNVVKKERVVHRYIGMEVKYDVPEECDRKKVEEGILENLDGVDWER